jgi:hypothetical protein
MWRPMWPTRPAIRFPVRSITNGVHVRPGWAARCSRCLDHHFGPGWLDHVDEPELWERCNDIPGRRSGRCAGAAATISFSFIRERMRSRFSQEHVGQSRIVSAGAMLDPRR